VSQNKTPQHENRNICVTSYYFYTKFSLFIHYTFLHMCDEFYSIPLYLAKRYGIKVHVRFLHMNRGNRLKILWSYTDMAIFVLRCFILTHPVIVILVARCNLA